MDSNRTAFRVAKESSFGVAPTAPVYKEVRRTSDGLAFTPTNEVSSEIEATRQITDLINTGREAGGDMAMELSIENMDVFLEGLFCNNWNRTPEVIQGQSWKYNIPSTMGSTRITSVTTTAINLAAATAANAGAAGDPASAPPVRP